MATPKKPAAPRAAVSAARSAAPSIQRRIEVYGPRKLDGKFMIEIVDDKSNKVVTTFEQPYSHQRSAVKAAQRELSFYRPGTAVLVTVQA